MISIKKINTLIELHKIAVLAEEIWHECFTDIISEEQIDYMVENFQSFKAMKNQVINQGYYYLAVRNDDELCGYIGVKPENDDRFFLSKLYLCKDMRGKGIATEMLRRVFGEARNIGKKSVYLTVNKHNTHAIEVYKKTGFSVIESVITDIGGGFVMDDYVMEYKL
ncbi:MAG: GNAT family N-acetyltransferase [Ruminococcus sp.]|nr:GNAT family N-acetyltransferase [Ruminococcus sp.]